MFGGRGKGEEEEEEARGRGGGYNAQNGPQRKFKSPQLSFMSRNFWFGMNGWLFWLIRLVIS